MLGALLSVALQPQAQRVIDIVCHKCEFVEDMTALRARYLAMRGNCIAQIEHQVGQAVENKLFRPGVDPHLAAVGFHALLDGLIFQLAGGRDRGFFPWRGTRSAWSTCSWTACAAPPRPQGRSTAGAQARPRGPRSHRRPAGDRIFRSLAGIGESPGKVTWVRWWHWRVKWGGPSWPTAVPPCAANA